MSTAFKFVVNKKAILSLQWGLRGWWRGSVLHTPRWFSSCSILTNDTSNNVVLCLRLIMLADIKHIKMSIATIVLSIKLIGEVKTRANDTIRAIEGQVSKPRHEIRILSQGITTRIEIPLSNS